VPALNAGPAWQGRCPSQDVTCKRARGESLPILFSGSPRNHSPRPRSRKALKWPASSPLVSGAAAPGQVTYLLSTDATVSDHPFTGTKGRKCGDQSPRPRAGEFRCSFQCEQGAFSNQARATSGANRSGRSSKADPGNRVGPRRERLAPAVALAWLLKAPCPSRIDAERRARNEQRNSPTRGRGDWSPHLRPLVPVKGWSLTVASVDSR
jgi:hypothetical protein